MQDSLNYVRVDINLRGQSLLCVLEGGKRAVDDIELDAQPSPTLQFQFLPALGRGLGTRVFIFVLLRRSLCRLWKFLLCIDRTGIGRGG